VAKCTARMQKLQGRGFSPILFTYQVSGNVIAMGRRATPSPGPPRLVKAPVAFHPLPQGGEGGPGTSQLK
jgi:hypothetical protein